MVSMSATPSSPPTGAFAEGTKARKEASPSHAPQKMDHDDPQKAGKNVALNANLLRAQVYSKFRRAPDVQAIFFRRRHQPRRRRFAKIRPRRPAPAMGPETLTETLVNTKFRSL
jgi:hypothetical protein